MKFGAVRHCFYSVIYSSRTLVAMVTSISNHGNAMPGIPVMTVSPAQLTVSPDDKIQLMCSVSQTRAHVKWYFNDMVS